MDYLFFLLNSHDSLIRCVFFCFSSVASLGTFAVEFIEYFDTSTSSVSWIGSILFFMIIPAGL